MSTVMGKNMPAANKVPKKVGRTFHLPLPIEETIKRVCPPHEPILRDQEYHILVRGLPTAQKKIWESIVNVANVLKALQWLKKNNELYKDIKLPSAAKELLDYLEDKNLDDSGYRDDPDDPGYGHDLDDDLINKSQESDTNAQSDTNVQSDTSALSNTAANECEHIDDEDINSEERLKEPVAETSSHDHGAAMLTQRNKDDEFYENFTIFPVNDKRKNKIGAEMYQMLKVDEENLDSREPKLDAKCFPDLYPH